MKSSMSPNFQYVSFFVVLVLLSSGSVSANEARRNHANGQSSAVHFTITIESSETNEASLLRNATEDLSFWVTALDPEGLRQGPAESLPPVEIDELPSGLRANLSLPEGLWRLDTRIEGFWAPSKIIELRSDELSSEQHVHLEARPGGVIEAKMRFFKEDEIPEGPLELRVVSAQEPRGLIQPNSMDRAESFCTFSDDEVATWRCPVPAGLGDLRIELKGFMPFYFWSRSIEPGKIENLGSLSLKKGASLVGWVIHPGEPPEVSRTQIELAPIQGDGIRVPANDRDAARGSLRTHSTTPSEEGFFRVTGLEAGRYQLKATSEGLATYENQPIPIIEGQETKLAEPVELSPPGSLTVYVEPPLTPSGDPWYLRLTRSDREVHDEPVEDWVDLSGTWIREGLDPGRHHLMLMSGEGRSRERWLSEEVEIRDHGTHFLEVPIVEVEGTLTNGFQEIGGTVFFGGRFGETSIRMEATEEEGFHGFLPQPGEWPVDVELDENAVQKLEPVEVERRSDGQPTTIELEVPFTNLFGKVVDRSGQPVRGGTVIVLNALGERVAGKAFIGRDGKFEMRGLKPGKIWVVAVGRAGDSQPELIDLREGLRTESLTLEVEPRNPNQIRLISDDGPVAGASIWYRGSGEGPRIDRQALSDPNGVAVLNLPDSVSSADLLVLPGTYAMKVVRIGLPRNETIPEIAISSLGSSLQIDLEGRNSGEFTIFKNGIQLVSVQALLSWAKLTTGQDLNRRSLGDVWLPQVDWGLYALCPQSKMSPGVRETLAMGGIPMECAGGYVAPGGVLALSLD